MAFAYVGAQAPPSLAELGNWSEKDENKKDKVVRFLTRKFLPLHGSSVQQEIRSFVSSIPSSLGDVNNPPEFKLPWAGPAPAAAEAKAGGEQVELPPLPPGRRVARDVMSSDVFHGQHLDQRGPRRQTRASAAAAAAEDERFENSASFVPELAAGTLVILPWEAGDVPPFAVWKLLEATRPDERALETLEINMQQLSNRSHGGNKLEGPYRLVQGQGIEKQAQSSIIYDGDVLTAQGRKLTANAKRALKGNPWFQPRITF